MHANENLIYSTPKTRLFELAFCVTQITHVVLIILFAITLDQSCQSLHQAQRFPPRAILVIGHTKLPVYQQVQVLCSPKIHFYAFLKRIILTFHLIMLKSTNYQNMLKLEHWDKVQLQHPQKKQRKFKIFLIK